MAYLMPYACQCWHGAAAYVAPDAAGAAYNCLSARTGNNSGNCTGCNRIFKEVQEHQLKHAVNCSLLTPQYLPYCYCNSQLSNVTYCSPQLPPPLPTALPPVSHQSSEHYKLSSSRLQHNESLHETLELLNAPPPPAPPKSKAALDKADVKEEIHYVTDLIVKTPPASPSANASVHSIEKSVTNQTSLPVTTTQFSPPSHGTFPNTTKIIGGSEKQDSEIGSLEDEEKKSIGNQQIINIVGGLTREVKINVLPKISTSVSEVQRTARKIINFPKPKSAKPPHRPTKLRDCRYCEKEHPIKKCFRFLKMSLEKRWDVIEKYNYCANCLAHSHTTPDCPCEERCKKCKEKHHRLLHDDLEKDHMKNRKRHAAENANNNLTESGKRDENNEGAINTNEEEPSEMLIIDLDDDEFEYFNIPLPDDVIIIDDDEGVGADHHCLKLMLKRKF